MKTKLLVSVSTCIIAVASRPLVQAEVVAAPAGLLVKWKDGPASATASRNNGRIGATVKRNFNAVGWQLVELPSGLSLGDGIKVYQAIDAVLLVEANQRARLSFPNLGVPESTKVDQTLGWRMALSNAQQAGLIPNDTKFDQQRYLKKIGATNAWAKTTGDSNVVVAVIDTGVDYRRPELAPNMWRNSGETGLDANGHDKATNGVDDDSNGYVDDAAMQPSGVFN